VLAVASDCDSALRLLREGEATCRLCALPLRACGWIAGCRSAGSVRAGLVQRAAVPVRRRGCRSGFKVAKDRERRPVACGCPQRVRRRARGCKPARGRRMSQLGVVCCLQGKAPAGWGFAGGRFAEPRGRLAQTTIVSDCLGCVMKPESAGR